MDVDPVQTREWLDQGAETAPPHDLITGTHPNAAPHPHASVKGDFAHLSSGQSFRMPRATGSEPKDCVHTRIGIPARRSGAMRTQYIRCPGRDLSCRLPSQCSVGKA